MYICNCLILAELTMDENTSATTSTPIKETSQRQGDNKNKTHLAGPLFVLSPVKDGFQWNGKNVTVLEAKKFLKIMTIGDKLERSIDWAVIVSAHSAGELHSNLLNNFDKGNSSITNITYFQMYSMNNHGTKCGLDDENTLFLVLVQSSTAYTEMEMRRMVIPPCTCKERLEVEQDNITFKVLASQGISKPRTIRGSMIKGDLVSMMPLTTETFFKIKSYADKNFDKGHTDGQTMSPYYRILLFMLRQFDENAKDEDESRTLNYAKNFILPHPKLECELKGEILSMEKGKDKRLREAKMIADRIEKTTREIMESSRGWMKTLFPWQQLVHDFVSIHPRDIDMGDRIIHFIIDDTPVGSAGKSQLAEITQQRQGRRVCILAFSESGRDLAEVVRDNQKSEVWYFDIPRHKPNEKDEINFDVLEQMKNRKVTVMKYKSEVVNLKQNHIIVFTNKMPNFYKDENVLCLSENRILVYELRLDLISKVHVLEQRKKFDVPIKGKTQNILSPNFMERMLTKSRYNDPYAVTDDSCAMCRPLNDKGYAGHDLSSSSIEDVLDRTRAHPLLFTASTKPSQDGGVNDDNEDPMSRIQRMLSNSVIPNMNEESDGQENDTTYPSKAEARREKPRTPIRNFERRLKPMDLFRATGNINKDLQDNSRGATIHNSENTAANTNILTEMGSGRNQINLNITSIFPSNCTESSPNGSHEFEIDVSRTKNCHGNGEASNAATSKSKLKHNRESTVICDGHKVSPPSKTSKVVYDQKKDSSLIEATKPKRDKMVNSLLTGKLVDGNKCNTQDHLQDNMKLPSDNHDEIINNTSDGKDSENYDVASQYSTSMKDIHNVLDQQYQHDPKSTIDPALLNYLLATDEVFIKFKCEKLAHGLTVAKIAKLISDSRRQRLNRFRNPIIKTTSENVKNFSELHYPNAENSSSSNGMITDDIDSEDLLKKVSSETTPEGKYLEETMPDANSYALHPNNKHLNVNTNEHEECSKIRSNSEQENTPSLLSASNSFFQSSSSTDRNMLFNESFVTDKADATMNTTQGSQNSKNITKSDLMRDMQKFLDEKFKNDLVTSVSSDVIKELLETEPMFTAYTSEKERQGKSKKDIINMLCSARRYHLRNLEKMKEKGKKGKATPKVEKVIVENAQNEPIFEDEETSNHNTQTNKEEELNSSVPKKSFRDWFSFGL